MENLIEKPGKISSMINPKGKGGSCDKDRAHGGGFWEAARLSISWPGRWPHGHSLYNYSSHCAHMLYILLSAIMNFQPLCWCAVWCL